MFKFNFQINEIDIDKHNFINDNVYHEETKRENLPPATPRHKSEEIYINNEMLNNVNVYQSHAVDKIINKNENIRHLIADFLLKDTQKNIHMPYKTAKEISCMYQAEMDSSDLIPGIYEGGAKIWECTDDLLSYLCKQKEEKQQQFNEFWQNKHVLDIGCGCGLLGIYAYKNGAQVDFQDYNKDVLEQITIPNVLLNMDTQKPANNLLQEINKNIKFYSGDWFEWLLEHPHKELYDVILTAETIYNPENYEKLLNCFYTKLKPQGVIWLAAKTYYFGVGGGLREFESLLLNDPQKRFQSHVVWHSTNGVKREILQIMKNEKS